MRFSRLLYRSTGFFLFLCTLQTAAFGAVSKNDTIVVPTADEDQYAGEEAPLSPELEAAQEPDERNAIEDDSVATQLCILAGTRASCDASAFCEWDGLSGQCGALNCEGKHTETACSASGKCRWDTNSSSCRNITFAAQPAAPINQVVPAEVRIDIEEDPVATQLCILADKQDTCEKSADCMWDIRTHICIGLSCEAFANEESCSEASKCYWNPNTELCKKITSLGCLAYATAAQCAQDARCAWDVNRGMCAEM